MPSVYVLRNSVLCAGIRMHLSIHHLQHIGLHVHMHAYWRMHKPSMCTQVVMILPIGSGLWEPQNVHPQKEHFGQVANDNPSYRSVKLALDLYHQHSSTIIQQDMNAEFHSKCHLP